VSRGSPLDDLYGLQFQPYGIGKDGGNHCRLIILSKRQDEYGANPNAFKYIMILTDWYSCSSHRKTFQQHAAVRSGMYDDVHRTGIFQETVRKLGNGACCGVAVGNTDGIPAKNTAQHSGTSPFRTWRIVFPVSLRKKKCRQPNLILTKTHRLHTRESPLQTSM
jgi:cell division protein FtsW